MIQSACKASSETAVDSQEFTRHYRDLKRLLGALKMENGSSLRREIFGDENLGRPLTTKDVKSLFRVLRKLQNQYEECSTPPIPAELEKSIRRRDSAAWLPWELEAIEKVEIWRSEVVDKRNNLRKVFETALEKIRRG